MTIDSKELLALDVSRFMEKVRSRWNFEETEFDAIENVLSDPECLAALPAASPADPKPAPDAMRGADFISDDWFSEHRPKATINVEVGARAIAQCRGHDPDELAPRTEMCTSDNEQVPWWKVFEEEAESCLSAWVALAAPVPPPDGPHETKVTRESIAQELVLYERWTILDETTRAMIHRAISFILNIPTATRAGPVVSRADGGRP